MKKTIFVTMVAVAVLFVTAACTSTPPAAPPAAADPVSDFIREVRRTAPENALLGIGTSNHSNRNLARVAAETRGRAEIARQVDVVVRNMVEDFTAGSEAEQQALLQFTMNVTQTLTQQAQRGATVRDEANIAGEQITVVMLTREALNEGLMSAHQSHQALAPHAGAAMWGLERMDRALNEQNTAPPVLRNYD